MKVSSLIIAFAICTLVSCQNESSTKQLDDTKRESAETPVQPLTLPYTAEANPETDQLELKFHKNNRPLTAKELITLLNNRYQKINLNLVKQQHDTIFVKIPDAFYLTQSIGTAGAESYLAETTFSLTEVNGIKAVNFDFEEGDHASPKTYTRSDFKSFH